MQCFRQISLGVLFFTHTFYFLAKNLEGGSKFLTLRTYEVNLIPRICEFMFIETSTVISRIFKIWGHEWHFQKKLSSTTFFVKITL